MADVRILGPLEASGPAGLAPVAGRRRRTLLGVLALRAGEVLSRPQLIEALWGSQPPPTAIKTLHSHLAVLRRALEAAGLTDALMTRAPGYAMLLPRTVVDAHRFEAKVHEARAAAGCGDMRSAAAALTCGLRLWRGEVFADCPPQGWGNAEAIRWQMLRLGAVEELWTAELACGNHTIAAVELEHLARTHPLRERVWELLMLALYRCGRRGESLLAYDRIRTSLRTELSVEPGPQLRRLHDSVLSGIAR